ncbi:nuclear transport factor 2 family protein [Kribbella sp. NPDC026611]|uniref:nuclear transport factor 2 family protein n=1 Tax=Kribbella sp. NPDC026611 TaxID=3154911 RepID=UPI0033F8F5F9
MAIREELLELEGQMWQANREGEGGFYARNLRDDAVVVSKYGVMGKAATVAGIQANRNPFLKTDRSEERVVVVDEHTAIVSYKVDVVALVNGAEVELPSYATSVWNNAAGEWKLVFHQQTAL